MSTPRTRKVASSLKRELAELLLFESRNPLFKELVITRVEVSKDLRVARVFYTYYVHRDIDRRKTDAQLEKAAPYFARQLRGRFTMKHFPELRFTYDTELEQAERIEDILKEIKPS
jgi:ribosome-binding factor A